MVGKSKTNITPAIRFRGFVDEWESLKLEEVVDVRSGRDYKHLTSGDIPVYGTGGYMLSVNEALSYNEDAIGIGRKGTIDKPYILNAPFWTVDTLFYAVPKEEYDLNFIFDFFLKIDWKKKDESTGVPSLSKNVINSIEFRTPSCNEQNIIGNYFRDLGKLIILQQRKYDKLKTIKKAMLEKLFPKDGADVPEIRFAGFTGAWERGKFKDLVISLTGGSSIKPDDYQDEGIRTIPKGAVNSAGVADLSGCKYISKDFFDRNISSKVSTNNLVTSLRDLVPSAPNMGRIVRVTGAKEDFLMPQGVYKIELHDDIDENFVIVYSNSDIYRKIITTEKNGSTQVHIRNSEFLDIDIPIPTSIEQKKIGAFFKDLDQHTTLQYHKLEKLKNMKKALLEKMFV